MKQAVIVIALTLVLVVGGTMVLLTQGQTQAVVPETAATAWSLLDARQSKDVQVRGKVVPANSVALSFPTKGLIPEGFVSELLVKEGDPVEQGALLARIDARDLELGVEEAQAALSQAQADYNKLLAGATPEQIEQAQAQLAQAQARVQQAASSVTPQDIAAAQAELAEARTALAQSQAGPNAAKVRAAQAAVEQAQARLQSERDALSARKTNAQLQLDQAANALRTRQDEYSRIYWENQARGGSVTQQDIDREAAAMRDVQDAEKALEQARISYEQAQQAEITGVAAAEAALKSTTSALDDVLAGDSSARTTARAAALARLAKAEADLARLRGGQQASAIEAAAAEQRGAQAALEQVASGPRDVDLASAAAHVQLAEVALKRSQLAMEMTKLHAPVAGTVVQVNLKQGEIPSATVPAIVLADVSTWQIATADLGELDVVRVAEGDPALITFDALPDFEITGKVLSVNTVGEDNTDTQGVTYEAIIALDQQDPRLRWNMSASVLIKPNAASAAAPSCDVVGCPALSQRVVQSAAH